MERLAKAQVRTGRRLDQLTAVGARTLHDRHRLPSHHQLAHLVVGTWGLAVVHDVVAPRKARSWSSDGVDLDAGGHRVEGAFAIPAAWTVTLAFTVAEQLPGWTVPMLATTVLHGVTQRSTVVVQNPRTNSSTVAGTLEDIVRLVSGQPRGLAPQHVVELATVLDLAFPAVPLPVDMAQEISRNGPSSRP